MTEGMLSREEFQVLISRGTTWEFLSRWLDVEPCDCGEEFCHGWQTVYRRKL